MTLHIKKPHALGLWIPDADAYGKLTVAEAISNVNRPVFIFEKNGTYGISHAGTAVIGRQPDSAASGHPLTAWAPELVPRDLGDPVFLESYNLKYPYICGAMANGITSVRMVQEAGKAGMLAFFGAAGLSIGQIENAVDAIASGLPDRPFGFNLIHSPNDPRLEMDTVQLYLNKGIRLISASAYLALTLPLVYYRVKGIYEDAHGNIRCPNKIIAKVSRIEIASKFLAPPPEKILAQLLDRQWITPGEAARAASVPMAEDITAEADSGGHTDNRPAIALLPTLIALKNHLSSRYGYSRPPRIGLGGGISTPYAAAAAFAMGAAFLVTGSVNQSCVEAGTSDTVKHLLASARQADVAMAPAADMFEIGARVQVLKRGTMFPLRAAKLYDLYTRHNRWEDIDPGQRKMLERDVFKCTFEEEWEQTKAYFNKREPGQIARAEKNEKHKMALVFRSYLGRASMWAIQGISERQMDYQIWCGPAIGAFNQWAAGTFLETPENRDIVTVAMNLLFGACVVTRASWLKHQGVLLPETASGFRPMPLSRIKELLGETSL
ncbi:MAG: PfaD family polyunsaturated fatty acid/polyketide biosynthesis protein [Desulfobacterales bacterium]